MQTQAVEGYRLSPQQRRLWRLQNGSSAFYAWCALKVQGSLDDSALRQAVERVISRHEILRVRFVRRAGMKMPIQVVGEENDVRWEEIDLQHMGASEQRAKLREIYQMGSAAGLGYDSQPVVSVRLVRLAVEESLLVISLPSLYADGWAAGSLAREIVADGPGCLGRAADVDDNLQYFYFAEWQNEIVESNDEEAERARAYWDKQASRNVSMALPNEKSAEGADRFAPELVECEIDAASVGMIREMAAGLLVSEREILAACWAALVRRLSGQDEVVLWDVIDGRKYEELQGTVGLYAKSVPLRIGMKEATPFTTLLLRLSGIAREGYEFHGILQ